MQQTALFSQARELLSVKMTLRSISLACVLLLISDAAYAAPDITAVLSNIQRIFGPLTLMVLWISYVAGIVFIFRAILLFKKFGSQQGQGEIGQPLTYLFVGTVLIFLPSASDITMNSLFGQTASIFTGSVNYGAVGTGSTLMSYAGSSGMAGQWASFANTLVLYMQFLGFLSFVKGWFIIAKSTSPSGAQGGSSLSKGITHIVGGIALINIVGVMNILSNTIWGTG